MKRKLLIILAAFTIAAGTVACTKPAEEKTTKTETTENVDAKENNEKKEEKEVNHFVNVDENDKKKVVELLDFLSTDDFSKIKGKLHEEVRQYQNDESYELNNNVFKDTGKLGELEGLTKQDREDEKLGKLLMYSGQIKGENQSLGFDLIVTDKDELIDWRLFPMQDQEANMKKYDNLVKKFEKIADLVESGDYEALKPELELMEMKEEQHKNFQEQLKTLLAQIKNRKEFRVVNLTDRSAVKSLEKIGVTGKIINAVGMATYEEGPVVQYRAVFDEAGRLLSIGLNPVQTQPQMQAPQMPEGNKTEENKNAETEEKKTE